MQAFPSLLNIFKSRQKNPDGGYEQKITGPDPRGSGPTNPNTDGILQADRAKSEKSTDSNEKRRYRLFLRI